MHKKIIISLLTLFIGFSAFSQETKTGIAPFKITLVNGKEYTYSEIKQNVPTVLVYFSPTCSHCINFTEELLKHEKEIAHKQIIMVTYEPVENIHLFDSTYKISSRPNFKIGTEGYSFIVRKFYNVERFPYIVLYNKQMQLVKTLSPSDSPEVLAKAVADY